MTGYPIEEAARIASSALVTAVPGGWGIPRFCRNFSNNPRSSAVSIVSAFDPIIGQEARLKGSARFTAVCPPN